MTCRDFRSMADSFLSQHTTTATNHDMLRHVEMCRACRADLNGRRRVRSALRAAFNGTEELEPPPDFAARLRRHVRHQENGERERPRTIWRRSVVGLAAGLVLAIGVTGALLRHPGDPSADALAHDAIGDHQNCALKYRKVRTPVPLPEAATRFDPDYSVLTTAPPNEVSTPGGLLRVVDRHACAYGDRRFGHVIMQYRGHVVSLLMTTGGAGSTVTAVDPIPHAIGQSTNGLSVVTVTAAGRSILLVGDLGRAELTELSTIIASPLAQRLMSGALVPSSPDFTLAAVRQ